MEAKDLRIGNLVMYSDDSTVFTVSGLHEFGMDCFDDIEETYIEYDQFEGITITEEWLLKFGFIKSNLDGDNAWLNLRYRYLNFTSDESVEFKKVYLTINKMDIICSYVHQLQNLYFILTGEELTIKE